MSKLGLHDQDALAARLWQLMSQLPSYASKPTFVHFPVNQRSRLSKGAIGEIRLSCQEVDAMNTVRYLHDEEK